MNKGNKQILIYGGTGYYGRKVVEKLVQKGQSVKVVSRDEAKARKILGKKVEIFQGDVTNHETIVESLKNVSSIVICLSAMSSKLIRKMKEIADRVGAVLMVDMAHIAGLIAADVHPSPIPFADVVTSTTHKTLRGPRGGLILAKEDYGIKLNREIFPGIQGGPLMHIIAAKAIAFKEALAESFKIYQINVVKNAKTLAQHLMKEDVRLISDGTDNHMILANLQNFNITGKDAEEALGRAGITVNKNSIPFEKLSPFITSGIRIGTPVTTSRGMKEPEMEVIAKLIVDVLKKPNDNNLIVRTRKKVLELCDAFPIKYVY